MNYFFTESRPCKLDPSLHAQDDRSRFRDLMSRECHSERQRRIFILFVGQNNQKQNRLSALASYVDYEMAEFIDLHFITGIEQDCRAQLFDHGGTIESITGLEPVAQENGAK